MYNNTSVAVNVQVNGENQAPLVMSHSKADVVSSGSLVAGANEKRKYLLLINNSDADIIIGLGGPVTEDKGILLRHGGSYQISREYLFTGEVHAIHKVAEATKVLDITEGE